MEMMALPQEKLVLVLKNTSLGQNKVFAFLSLEVFVVFCFFFHCTTMCTATVCNRPVQASLIHRMHSKMLQAK